MRFESTRRTAPAASFSEAIVNGIAPDGGLYLPTEWPQANLDSFGDASLSMQLICIVELVESGDMMGAISIARRSYS